MNPPYIDKAYDILLTWTCNYQFLVSINICNSAAFVYLTRRDFVHALILAKLIVVSRCLVYDKVEIIYDFLI
jgi:hypothetical protein